MVDKDEIRKVFCFFEQSGTFKNEFIKLGIPAEDYDIQNDFGQTDHVIDLFAEINKAYDAKASIFDTINSSDLVIAFFPCIYFESVQMLYYCGLSRNIRSLSERERTDDIIQRVANRASFITLLYKLVALSNMGGVGFNYRKSCHATSLSVVLAELLSLYLYRRRSNQTWRLLQEANGILVL